jgi:hypothetical protein
MWLIGLGCFVLGAVIQSGPLLVLGIALLLAMFLLLRSMASYSKLSPLRLGIVNEVMGLRPFFKDLAMAKARVSEEEEVLVGIPLSVAKLVEEQGCAEVLFLHKREWMYSLVIAARAIRRNESMAESSRN